MPKPSSPPHRHPAHPNPPETVDPGWLLKAGAVAFAVALLCALALFWTTFYYTQWQYVLAPSRTVATNPTAAGLAFTEVHFGVDATGQPQLDGWWIPADTPSSPIVLLLHDGKGSMSDALPQARTLHDANLNVLLFDYRGFGRSGGAHPTQALMQADAESALAYLRETRHIDLSHVIVYGNGLGASLAVKLCSHYSGNFIRHPRIRQWAILSRKSSTTPAPSWSPCVCSFMSKFPLAVPLQTLTTPKLVLTYAATPTALDSQPDRRPQNDRRAGFTQRHHGDPQRVAPLP